MAHHPPATPRTPATADDLRIEIALLRSEMHAGFADLRTEIADSATRQIRWMVTFTGVWSSVLVACRRP